MHVLLWLAFILLTVGSRDAQDTPEPLLVAEHGVEYSLRDGVLELGSGRGWLRTPRLYLDFQLSFDFRSPATPADAGVLIRTWTGEGEWPGRGYRIVLPSHPVGDPLFALVGHKQKVKVIRPGTVSSSRADQWQHVEVTAEGRQITIALNSTVAGVYEVERYGGHVLFENRRGRVQFRNVQVSPRESQSSVLEPAPVIQRPGAPGMRSPKLVREVKPIYTVEAMKRGAQGLVGMVAVVLPDGSTTAVRVIRSLDPNLDLSAIAAVRQWGFRPAMVDGKAVAVWVEVEMNFTFYRNSP